MIRLVKCDASLVLRSSGAQNIEETFTTKVIVPPGLFKNRYFVLSCRIDSNNPEPYTKVDLKYLNWPWLSATTIFYLILDSSPRRICNPEVLIMDLKSIFDVIIFCDRQQVIATLLLHMYISSINNQLLRCLFFKSCIDELFFD